MKRVSTIILAMVMVFTLAAICPAARAEDRFGTGVIQDNVYWNETMAIGCVLDENWYFYTQEEILSVNGMTADVLEGQIAELIENGGTLTDMFAQNQETGATVNVVFERLNIANSLILNEERYVEASVSVVEDAFEQMGIENLEIAQENVEFLGQEHRCMVISGTINQVPIYEVVIVMKDGRNITSITVFSVDQAEIQSVLSCFFNSLD